MSKETDDSPTPAAEDSSQILQQIMDVIEDRRKNRPQGSYVSQLFDSGPTKITAKILEESQELVEATNDLVGNNLASRDALIHETADLWFHTLVLLGWSDVRLDDVLQELNRRFGTSGLEEKQSRSPKNR